MQNIPLAPRACLSKREYARECLSQRCFCSKARSPVLPNTASQACRLLLPLDWLEHLETAHECLINGHHGSRIVELAAVVGRAKECDELTFGKELVAILNNLVCTANKVHVVLLEKAGHHIWAKDEGHTAIILGPACNIFVRICPKEIANQACVWYIRWSHQSTNLFEVGDLWRQAAVHTHDLLIDETTNWQAVEDIAKLLPQLDVVAALALIIEAIDSSDACTLVVATEQEKVLRVLDLVGKEENDGLDALLAAVNVITEEDVVALWWEAPVLKQTEQVVVLAMHVSANLQRRFQLQQRVL
mmetsp:Transcript_53453/g.127485  ORF Transcript_53453/g.127485 Transcript_53453/m.127485 type:complete len:302 (+) Transcript_53453:112-1017(+)